MAIQIKALQAFISNGDLKLTAMSLQLCL